jgi:hypothetical protein
MKHDSATLGFLPRLLQDAPAADNVIALAKR